MQKPEPRTEVWLCPLPIKYCDTPPITYYMLQYVNRSLGSNEETDWL